MEPENYDVQNEESETLETDENVADDSLSESEDTVDNTNDTEGESEEVDYQKLYEEEKQAREKAEKAIVKNKQKSKEAPKKADDTQSEDSVIARLEIRGVMDAEDQAYVLRFAKAEGISPVEALNDVIVKDRLAANEKARKESTAKVRGNNRTAAPGDTLDTHIRRYQADGTLPEDPAVLAQMLKKLN